MLSKRYLMSVKNVDSIFQKIIDGTAPPTFNLQHLQGLGFKSSSDRAILPVLKDLGFLSESGAPTERYHAYRDRSKSRAVMAQALREAYSDLFHINAYPTEKDREAITGKFKTTHNVSDRVAELQAMTFFAFLKLADLKDQEPAKVDTFPIKLPPEADTSNLNDRPPDNGNKGKVLELRYNIEVHLPATKDIEIYNAIFKSLKEHLLD